MCVNLYFLLSTHVYINVLSRNTITALHIKIEYRNYKYLMYKNTWKYHIGVHFDIKNAHAVDLYCAKVYTTAILNNHVKIFSKQIKYGLTKTTFTRMTYGEFKT